MEEVREQYSWFCFVLFLLGWGSGEIIQVAEARANGKAVRLELTHYVPETAWKPVGLGK